MRQDPTQVYRRSPGGLSGVISSPERAGQDWRDFKLILFMEITYQRIEPGDKTPPGSFSLTFLSVNRHLAAICKYLLHCPVERCMITLNNLHHRRFRYGEYAYWMLLSEAFPNPLTQLSRTAQGTFSAAH